MFYRILSFSVLALSAIVLVDCGCQNPPQGLDSYCPDDPMVENCPEGNCGLYPCIAYCIDHYPEQEIIPESGMGSWCDLDMDYGDFCSEFGMVDECHTWCTQNPGQCGVLCGDGDCVLPEAAISCPADCPSICGDGSCTRGENHAKCEKDCVETCFNGLCDEGETSFTCPNDCPPECEDGDCVYPENAGSCPQDCPELCGDSFCSHEETVLNCPQDCPVECGDGHCTHEENAASCEDDCPQNCGDGFCTHEENSFDCGVDCDGCGDGTCAEDENAARCGYDCPAVCGDGFCTHEETAHSCPKDCPAVCNDGFVTHEEDCEPEDTRPCSTICDPDGEETGTEACTDGCNWSEICVPPAESCNGRDDDCDGNPDEDFECVLDEETTCETTCETTGTMICNGACEWPLICTPPEDVCNGINDDCDADGADEDCECATGWVQEVTISMPHTFRAVWGFSWDNVYAVTSFGVLYHFDGFIWELEELPDPPFAFAYPRDIWGAAPDDIYVVGLGNYIAHYDGTDWEIRNPGTEDANFNAVSGTSERNAYFVGDNGIIVHYTGIFSSPMDSGTTENLNDISVWEDDGQEYIKAVGNNGVDIFLDESEEEWRGLDQVVPITVDLNATWRRDRNDVYNTGDGITYHSWYEDNPFNPESEQNAIFGIDEANAFIFTGGAGGSLYRYEGSHPSGYDPSDWAELSFPSSSTIYGIWASSEYNVFVVTSGAIYHRCGSAW